jgi:hypothetical protein
MIETMPDDRELLRRFVERRSAEAFGELVRRHLNFVYFSALRRTNGDTHLARDISQIVFITLAQNAASLARFLTPVQIQVVRDAMTADGRWREITQRR